MLRIDFVHHKNYSIGLSPIVCLLSLISVSMFAMEQKEKQDSRTRKPTALVECQKEVERLKSENSDLQKKLNEILMHQIDAMNKPSEAETNALAAVKALGSVVDSSGHQDFAKYLLDAKVKVESLSPGPRRTEMTKVIGTFLDLDSAWRAKINQIGLFGSTELDTYTRNFPNIYSDLERNQNNYEIHAPPAYMGYHKFYYPDAVLSYMMRQAKEMTRLLTITN